MRGILRTLGVVALAACSTSSVLAQSRPQGRKGLVGSVGLGVGSGQVTCQTLCQNERRTAPAGYLRIGGPIAPDVIFGAEMNIWSKGLDESDFVSPDPVRVRGRASIVTVNAVGQWYPWVSRGFFVSTGVGVGRYQMSYTAAGFPRSSSHTTAPGYQIGIGDDIPLSFALSITPYATYFGSTAAGTGLYVDTTGEQERFGANVFHVGVGLTWH